ncbi:hypothetical protein SNEBB_009253 [Seison nebaliae]|nr:hypothetical protein SNEBB_009253 [Seison nebaliae]
MSEMDEVTFDTIGDVSVDEMSSIGPPIIEEETTPKEFDEKILQECNSFFRSSEALNQRIAQLELFMPKEQSVDSDENLYDFNRIKKFKLGQTVRRVDMTAPANGIPIDTESATLLRLVTVGSIIHPIATDWRNAAFEFRSMYSECPWSLKYSGRTTARGLILAIQAHITKRLFFTGIDQTDFLPGFQPTEPQRKMALAHALTDCLWKCANTTENRFVNIVLTGRHPSVKTTQSYRSDGFTELLLIYKFHSREEAFQFLTDHLEWFTRPGGVLLFLYSLLLTRTIEGLIEDQNYSDYTKSDSSSKISIQHSCIIDNNIRILGVYEECRVDLILLALTGYAVANVHNGNIEFDDDGEPMERPSLGVHSRSDIGFLRHVTQENLIQNQLLEETEEVEEDDEKEKKHQVKDVFLQKIHLKKKNPDEVGSMLKTPMYPIWVTLIDNYNFGILFSTNGELLRNWRLEHRFQLNYYNGLDGLNSFVRLFIDTVNNYGDTAMQKLPYYMQFVEQDIKIPNIVRLIWTKWPKCDVVSLDSEIQSLLNII